MRAGQRLSEVKKLRDRFDKDPEHSDQVHRLAKLLLRKLNKLDLFCAEDSIYLESGALLHDIGQSVSLKLHHKHSRDIILREGIPGFRKKEIMAIACIAKFHRKDPPSLEDPDFAVLSKKWQATVRTGSAILRLADGLDRSHRNLIKKIKLKVRKKNITFYLHSNSTILTEIWGAIRKKQFFEDLTDLLCTFEAVPKRDK